MPSSIANCSSAGTLRPVTHQYKPCRQLIVRGAEGTQQALEVLLPPQAGNGADHRAIAGKARRQCCIWRAGEARQVDPVGDVDHPSRRQAPDLSSRSAPDCAMAPRWCCGPAPAGGSARDGGAAWSAPPVRSRPRYACDDTAAADWPSPTRSIPSCRSPARPGASRAAPRGSGCDWPGCCPCGSRLVETTRQGAAARRSRAAVMPSMATIRCR